MFSLFSNKKKQKNVGYSNEVGAFREKPELIICCRGETYLTVAE